MAAQEGIDFKEREKVFYSICRDTGVFSDFPEMNGAHFMPPFGRHILSGLESYLLGGLMEAGYSWASLPPMLPGVLVQHLNQRGLCQVKGGGYLGNVNFFCAPDTEPLAAYLAMNEAAAGREFPKIITVNDLVRDESRHALIKELGYKGIGINSFFRSEEEAVEELLRMFGQFYNDFNEINVPVVKVVEDFAPKGQKKLYSYVPFSGMWASLFCVSVPGTKYTGVINSLPSRKHVDEIDLPLQLNAGFTQRVLASYLSFHFDESGFILDREFSPKQVYLASSSMPEEIAGKIKQGLSDKGITFQEGRRQNPKMSYFTFKKQGLPVMADAGQHQFRLRTRNGAERWIGDFNSSLEESVPLFIEEIADAAGSFSPDISRTVFAKDRKSRDIDTIMPVSLEITSPQKEYLPDILYQVPAGCDDSFLQKKLEKLGFSPDSDYSLFVMKRY